MPLKTYAQLKLDHIQAAVSEISKSKGEEMTGGRVCREGGRDAVKDGRHSRELRDARERLC